MGRGLSDKQFQAVKKGLEKHRRMAEERARKAAGLPPLRAAKGERRPRVEPARWDARAIWDDEE
jgi:hypothetical protein